MPLDTTDLPLFLTTNEVCDLLRVTPKTLRKMISSLEIPAYRVGGSANLTRFNRADVLALLRPVVPAA